MCAQLSYFELSEHFGMTEPGYGPTSRQVPQGNDLQIADVIAQLEVEFQEAADQAQATTLSNFAYIKDTPFPSQPRLSIASAAKILPQPADPQGAFKPDTGHQAVGAIAYGAASVDKAYHSHGTSKKSKRKTSFCQPPSKLSTETTVLPQDLSKESSERLTKVLKIGDVAQKKRCQPRKTKEEHIPDGILPKGHIVHKGRKRTSQVQKMTQEQIQVERMVRLEKNRQAARISRANRRQQFEALESEVIRLTTLHDESQNTIAELRAEVTRLKGSQNASKISDYTH